MSLIHMSSHHLYNQSHGFLLTSFCMSLIHVSSHHLYNHSSSLQSVAMAEPLEFNSKGVDGEVWVEIEGEGGEEEGREEKRGRNVMLMVQ